LDFAALLKEFTSAAEAGDGKRLGALFTADSIYHDTFYGEFRGPAVACPPCGLYNE
jgi:hypothetical protein